MEGNGRGCFWLILSYHVVPCCILSQAVMSCCILSYPECPGVSCGFLVSPCRIWSYANKLSLILLHCCVLLYRVASCHVLWRPAVLQGPVILRLIPACPVVSCHTPCYPLVISFGIPSCRTLVYRCVMLHPSTVGCLRMGCGGWRRGEEGVECRVEMGCRWSADGEEMSWRGSVDEVKRGSRCVESQSEATHLLSNRLIKKCRASEAQRQ